MKFSWAIAVVALSVSIAPVRAAFVADPNQANGYLLSNLITNNLSITEGDKTFSGFGWSPNATGGGAATFDPAGIKITPGTFDGNIAIEISGAISSIAPPTTSETLDVLFSYNVTAPGPFIDDIGAHFNGACNGPGICSVQNTETGTTKDLNGGATTTVGQIIIQNAPPGPLDAHTFLYNPYNGLNNTPRVAVQHLSITKDILLVANASTVTSSTAGNTVASFSVMDQYFSQVPEPRFFVVLAIAMFGLLWRQHRRRTV
jgi:hypothetical protein